MQDKKPGKPTNQNYRQILVELEVVDVLNKEFAFVTNKELDKASRIIAVESFHADVVAFTPTSKTVVSKAVHNKTFLKLCDSTGALMRTVPLSYLTVDGSRQRVEPVNLESFDMQQSGVLISELTGTVAGTKFLFLFTYEKKVRRTVPENEQ